MLNCNNVSIAAVTASCDSEFSENHLPGFTGIDWRSISCSEVHALMKGVLSCRWVGTVAKGGRDGVFSCFDRIAEDAASGASGRAVIAQHMANIVDVTVAVPSQPRRLLL